MRDSGGRIFWTTKNEMDFIKSIGTGQYSKSARIMGRSQIELLEGYVRAAKNRDRWDGVDKEACISLAEEKIKSLKLLESAKAKVVKHEFK